MAPLARETTEADGYYFLLLLELILIILSESRSFLVSDLIHKHKSSAQSCCRHIHSSCTRDTWGGVGLTTPGGSINGRGYGSGVNMNSWQMEWTLPERQWVKSTARRLQRINCQFKLQVAKKTQQQVIRRFVRMLVRSLGSPLVGVVLLEPSLV